MRPSIHAALPGYPAEHPGAAAEYTIGLLFAGQPIGDNQQKG
jgi:hypothetical protein